MVQDVLTQFLRELTRARRGVVRGVHQARVASRRLREGLGALDDVLPERMRRRAGRALRHIGRALGDVRECDVTLALITIQAKRFDWPAAAVAHVRVVIHADRTRRHRRLVRLLGDDKKRDAVVALRTSLPGGATPDVRRRGVEAARVRRRRRAAGLAQEVGRLGAVYVPDQLHAVRLAVKKLRYALEWESQVGRKAWLRERRALEAAQERLGAWHDVLVLQERLHRLRRTGDCPSPLVADLKHMAAQLERECRASHAAMLADVSALTRVTTAAMR
jgi:CHAD domain-containing protein